MKRRISSVLPARNVSLPRKVTLLDPVHAFKMSTTVAVRSWPNSDHVSIRSLPIHKTYCSEDGPSCFLATSWDAPHRIQVSPNLQDVLVFKLHRNLLLRERGRSKGIWKITISCYKVHVFGMSHLQRATTTFIFHSPVTLYQRIGRDKHCLIFIQERSNNLIHLIRCLTIGRCPPYSTCAEGNARASLLSTNQISCTLQVSVMQEDEKAPTTGNPRS